MAEHITRNDGVVGSIPTASSKARRNFKIPAGFCFVYWYRTALLLPPHPSRLRRATFPRQGGRLIGAPIETTVQSSECQCSKPSPSRGKADSPCQGEMSSAARQRG